MHYETATLHAPRCLEKFRTAVCVSVCVREKNGFRKQQRLTQGGSVYDITVGTVVNINIHSMVLFYLYTAGKK